MCHLCEGGYLFQCIGDNNMDSMDYMDPGVRCPQNTVKHNHSLRRGESSLCTTNEKTGETGAK